MKSAMLSSLLALCLCFAGCSRPPATLDSWMQSVGQFVEHEGNGDPGELRNLPTTDGQRRFGLIQSSHPGSSTDVVGVLLGHRSIHGRQWFVFLVGQVDRGLVRDIRIAAMTRVDDELFWQIGQPGDEALAAYRKLHTPEAAERRLLSSWPAGTGRFSLEVTGSTIVVVETLSKARWTLAVTPPPGVRA